MFHAQHFDKPVNSGFFYYMEKNKTDILTGMRHVWIKNIATGCYPMSTVFGMVETGKSHQIETQFNAELLEEGKSAYGTAYDNDGEHLIELKLDGDNLVLKHSDRCECNG